MTSSRSEARIELTTPAGGGRGERHDAAGEGREDG
jgi:hypothetical protein